MALKLAEINESFRMLHDHRNVIRDCGLIFGTWSALLLVLFLLQTLGLGVGFDVWPLGEDRVWIDILQRGQGGSAANIFWHINDRNPLSPWWYIALKNVILGVDPGLLIIRYVVGLGLALATYFLVVELAGRQARMFALGVALLVAVWMPNGYLDQIYWNFQAALIASMISVLAYARFLNGGRGDHRWYALSLVCWFLAIASYSIQCGAVVAVGYLAFTRAAVTPKGGWRRLAAKLSVTITDTASYAVLLALFLLLWRTTVLNPSTYSLQPMSLTWWPPLARASGTGTCCGGLIGPCSPRTELPTPRLRLRLFRSCSLCLFARGLDRRAAISQLVYEGSSMSLSS